MNRLDPELIRKYFKKRPGAGMSIFLIVIGGIAILGAFSLRHTEIIQISLLVGSILILIGLIRLIKRLGSRLSDDDIDNQFQDDLKEIARNALNKLGLDETQLTENRKEPLMLKGPILWTTTGVNKKDLLWRKGKDDIVRFAIYRVTIIYFSKHLLASFACDFNFIKNVTLNEATDEYYYKDIVSVSTSETSTSYVLPNGVKLTRSQEFRLSLSNGEAIKVFIDSGKLNQVTKGNIPTEEAEKAVQIIRTILRDKKQ
ncbi:hypothetical protein BH10BAC3_BH10BAC3_11950 [soil metagenome]